MEIASGCVVTFHYRLSVDNKELESSYGDDPMAYLHGKNNIVIGLEEKMLGKVAGDEFTAVIPPEKAYGFPKENSIQRVLIKHLHNAKKLKNKLKPGMLVHVNTDQGAKQCTVVKVGRFNVDVDTNHPLAGKGLCFDVKIESVRPATKEEIAHGHAHGIGGYNH